MSHTPEKEITLTQFSKGAGCGCKIAPSVLEAILHKQKEDNTFERLLVGNQSNDDAAVYDMGNGEALISTTDFFMPVVDDAFDFGRIASANSISDVYAMGGKPLMAIAILGWPVSTLPTELATRVLEGARAICKEAGIPLAGGHSVDAAEPFFGLAVTGLAPVRNIKRNDTAREGDIIFLTKPLGTGVLSTAQKRGVLQENHLQPLINSMTRLNNIGHELGKMDIVSAMTDVTGFGLSGHLIEMMEGSEKTAVIDYSTIPVLPGVADYISQSVIPDATYRNWKSYGSKVLLAKGLNVMQAFSLLPDPQTNGGLLITVSAQGAGEVQNCLSENGLHAVPIGRVMKPEEKRIIVNS